MIGSKTQQMGSFVYISLAVAHVALAKRPVRGRCSGRQAQARYYETAAGNVDPTLGIVKTLLS